MKIFYLFLAVFIFALVNVAAQTPENSPKTINGGIINGKATSLPKPPYQPAARAVKAGGTVNVQVVIDEEGNVISASAVSGHPLLRAACEQAARGAKFSPTVLSGSPVKVTGIVTYNFTPAESVEKPNEQKGYEEQTEFMGLGVFLTFAEFLSDDQWEPVPEGMLNDSPDIKSELSPLVAIKANTPKESRNEIIRAVIRSLDSKLKGAEAWQFEFGRTFASLIFEFKVIEESPANEINEKSVKLKLEKLNDSILSAPADFPAEVLDGFKEVVKYRDISSLNSDPNKRALFQSILKVLNIISPNPNVRFN